ncbi:MAG: hypothetical protein KAJ06_05710, partial [Gammaproteobacteria bacterium]|nr:hypothetical protein [Gammaproteobacteria bacterium]
AASTSLSGYLSTTDWNTFNSKANANQTMYIGTTIVAINRASAPLTLAGITLTTPDIGTPSAGVLTNCTFPTLNQNTTGSAATLTTPRTIGGVSFDGSANIVPNTIAIVDESSDTTCFPLFVTAATGSLQPKTASGLSFNSSTDVLTATGFSGPLTGNVTGDCSGTAATVTGATQASITTCANLTTVGALNAGSITSAFGSINNGSSTIATTGAISGGLLNVTTDIVLTEAADHTSTPGAGFGYVWVKNTTPSTLIFTDDAGTDTTLGSGSASVEKIGFPAESMYYPVTNPAEPSEVAGTGVYAGWSIVKSDDTTAEHMVCRSSSSISYDGGNMVITARAKPSTTPGSTKTLIYHIYAVGIDNSEAHDSAVTVDTGVDITFNFDATTLQTDSMEATATIDPSNVADGDVLVLEFIRNVATDTLIGDGEWLGFTIEYNKP